MKWTRGRRHHSWWFIDLEMKVSWWSRLRKGVQDPCVVGADEPFPCLAYLLSWSPVTRVLPPWQGYDHETGRIREGGVREIGGHEIGVLVIRCTAMRDEGIVTRRKSGSRYVVQEAMSRLPSDVRPWDPIISRRVVLESFISTRVTGPLS